MLQVPQWTSLTFPSIVQAQGITPRGAEDKLDTETSAAPSEDTEPQKPYLKEEDPVFGIGKLECGIFRDLDARIDR